MIAPVTLVLPGHPPSPNRLRGHWAKRYRATSPWKQSAFAVTKRAMAEHGPNGFPWTRATLHVLFSGPRLWDRDNCVASLKPVIDGVQQAGLIMSDRLDHLALDKLRWMKSKTREVRLIFVEGMEG